ncbi:hypothetical protein [Dipodfec virus UOA04_Rod_618]|nr:hypothetical protein [Dipodfec virus UOA04_Rod_618]
MENWIEILCCFLCVIHLIVGLITTLVTLIKNHSLGKKINGLCDKCSLPTYENETHKCLLSDEELNKVVDLLISLKGEKK